MKRIIAITLILSFVLTGSVFAAEKPASSKPAAPKVQVEIFPATVGTPRDLLQKGSGKDVDKTVASIERVMQKSMLSGKIEIGNQEIYVSTLGEARVVKSHFEYADNMPYTKELMKLMKQYGYTNYTLDVFYDNPNAAENPLNQGPICIRGDIGGNPYTYYFSNNTLIRRIDSQTSSDNIKTNDFLNQLYKIVWKNQEIKRTEILTVSEVPWSDDSSKITTDTYLISFIDKNYKDLKKKFGAHKDYASIKADLKKNPFWYYCLTYKENDFILHSDNDKIAGLYTLAGNLWDIPKDGMNVNELIFRTDAKINDVYYEECMGELFVGNEGDTIVSLELVDHLLSMPVDNGRIMPDTSVQIW